MKDYKKLSESTFNIQAETYDTDKNGKHARNLYGHIIDILSPSQISEIIESWCGTGEKLSNNR